MSFKVTIISASAILAIGCLLFVHADVSHLQLRIKRSPQWWRQRDNDGPQYSQYDQGTSNNNNFPQSRQYYPSDSGNVRGTNNYDDNNNYQRSDPPRSSGRNFIPNRGGYFPGNNYYTGGSDYYSGASDFQGNNQNYPSSSDYYPSNGGFDQGNGYYSGGYFPGNGGYNPGNNGNPNFFQGGSTNRPGFNAFGPERPTSSAGADNVNGIDTRVDSESNAPANQDGTTSIPVSTTTQYTVIPDQVSSTTRRAPEIPEITTTPQIFHTDDKDDRIVVPSTTQNSPISDNDNQDSPSDSSSHDPAPSSPAFTTSIPVVTTVTAPATTSAPAVTTTSPPVTTSSAPVTTISPVTSTTIQEEKKTTPVMFQPINGTKVISNTAGVPIRLSTSPVNDNCLKCLCEASSQCDKSKACYSNGCGMFRITEIFWLDVDRPVLPGADEEAEDAFKNCALDEDCATRAIQLYMKKYRQDCNSDGIINCYDYAAIHKFGGYGCHADFSVSFYSKLHGCLQQTIDEDQAI